MASALNIGLHPPALETTKLKAEQKQIGQRLNEKLAEVEEFKSLIKNNPALYPDANAKKARLDELEKEAGKLSVEFQNKGSEVWKLEQGQTPELERAKTESKSTESQGTGTAPQPDQRWSKSGKLGPPSSSSPSIGLPLLNPQDASKQTGLGIRWTTVYANIKADEEAQRRGESALPTPEQTLKLGFNPLPIPGRGEKDTETGAGSDPRQATIGRIGKIDIPEDEYKTFHIPYQGNLYFEYMPRDYQALVGRTTGGGAGYPSLGGIEIQQRDFHIGNDWYRRVGLEYSYGKYASETFLKGTYVKDPCVGEKPAPPGMLPASLSAVGNELPRMALKVENSPLPDGSDPR